VRPARATAARGVAVILGFLLTGSACATSGSTTGQPATSDPAQVQTPSPQALPTPPARPSSAAPTPTRPATQAAVVVRYRIVRHTSDSATRAFAAVVDATLTDRRGWQRAGFRLLHDQSARYTVLIAEPDEVQRRCRPYDVYRKYSCQNGPLVAINAERWRHATPEWTGTLAAYRQMLINHEFGHLLGMHHPPSPQCPRRGVKARVMAQQSTELNGCLPNPWPLPAEIARAARHDLPLAPPYEP
jgi:hypothetical protein